MADVVDVGPIPWRFIMMDPNKVTPFNTGPILAPTPTQNGPHLNRDAGKLMECVKDKTDIIVGHMSEVDTDDIKEHMPVMASCGEQIGVVDDMDGQAIKLTKAHSKDGLHHFIPLSWVGSVDDAVHLNRNSGDTEREWKTDAASCREC
jgi:hypothetical protein